MNNLTGADLIAAERQRQIEKEGFTAAHDDVKEQHGQLIAAAICYAQLPLIRMTYTPAAVRERTSELLDRWPWDEEYWKPSDQAVRNLVKAGALIAAEIDRLQRAAIEAERATNNAEARASNA